MFESDLIEFVAENSVTTEDGEHLVEHMFAQKFVKIDGQLRSLQRASGYLGVAEWGPTVSTCGQSDCLRPDHLEEASTVLVASHAAPTLGDLYRRAQSRGLVQPQTAYA